MADHPGHDLGDHEGGVQPDRNGEGGAMAAAMMMMTVPVAMTVSMPMMMVMMVMMVGVMVMVVVFIVARMGGIVIHYGSFRCCCVAQLSHRSRIQLRQRSEYVEHFTPVPQVLKDACPRRGWRDR
jgi:hypothetical protein